MNEEDIKGKTIKSYEVGRYDTYKIIFTDDSYIEIYLVSYDISAELDIEFYPKGE